MYCLLISNNNKNIITSGNDERPNYVDKELKINYVNFQKKQLLNYLESDKISIFDKINIINVNKTPKPINILDGGLLHNWYFDM